MVQTAANYTALATDVIIEVTNTSAARTITLPAPSAAAATSNVGKFYIIKDTSGGAGTNSITITPASGTIDGAANTSIQTNYGTLQVFSDGTNYYLQGLWVNPSTYNPGVWSPYPSMTVNGKTFPAGTIPITATTNPNKSATATESAYYMQIGKLLIISWQFSYTTGGSAGSGTYLYSIPTGFTINTAIALPLSATINNYPYSMGMGMINIQNAIVTTITSVARDATTFYFVDSSSANTPIGSGRLGFNYGGNYVIGITVFVPII